MNAAAPAAVSIREAAQAKGCVHCGESLPAEPIQGAAETELFCCRGCSIAFEILKGAGLASGYYDLRRRLREKGRPVGEASGNFAHFDDKAFEEHHTKSLSGEKRAAEFYLEGVHCAACVWVVERLSQQADGILSARLDLGRSHLQVIYDAASKPLARLAGLLSSIGYRPHPLGSTGQQEAERKERHALLIRLGVAGACAGNIMLFAAALYSAEGERLSAAMEGLFTWGSFLLSLPVIFYSARPFFRSAWGGLKAGTLHMDVPVSLGLSIGFLSSTINTIRGEGAIWFDTLAGLVFLLLVGRLLLDTGRRKAAEASRSLFSYLPTSALRIESPGTAPRQIALESVLAGDLLFVPTGDPIPVDGVVVEGHSHVSEALLTGESAPVPRGLGEAVFAGTSVTGGSLTIRAEQTGEKTRLSRLSKLVEESAARRAPIVAQADRIAAWFVGAVLLIASATFAGWYFFAGDPETALRASTAVLVVSCLCALGLATPFSLAAAIGKASRLGILIKGPEALERLAKVQKLYLDKTGTLTEGRPQVVERLSLSSEEETQEALALAAAAERHSTHPLARAISEFIPPQTLRVEEFHQEPGRGIRARVRDKTVLAGNAAWLASQNVDLPLVRIDDVRAFEEKLAASTVLIAVEGHLRAALFVADRLRQDAADALKEIRDAGIEVAILSGDAEGPVKAAARELGIGEFHSGFSPEQKAAFLSSQEKTRLCGMAGDGVNDAAALAAAGVGIAVHGGSEAAFQAADVATAKSGVLPLAQAIFIARKGLGRARTAIALSLTYNTVVTSLAAMGFVTPLWAAILMPISSLSVIALALKQ
ncbi:MAG: heavy metal translocating P-type ATPase metal-binding domain-containing protein [Bdellovibrionota bacterium]